MIHLDDLLAATGGRVHGTAGATVFDAFCYDSRLVQPSQLFLAVKTERGDGHAYIRHACEGGATGVLCQEPPEVAASGVTCVVVPDTRQAIQDWARTILAKQGVQVIGVTGSVGKTTAKEAIAAVLAARHVVFKNRANYNGLYGLPIALGELRPEQRIAVLEIAADHPGEIGRLGRIAPPQIAVVTTVEPAHLETFGSLEAIAREKGDLVAALPADGLAVLNADDPRVLGMAERTAAAVVTYGTSHVPGTFRSAWHVQASDIVVTRAGLRFTVDTPAGRRTVRLPLLGRHQVYAALAAIAVGLAYQIDLDAIVAQLAELPRLPGRLNPLPGQHGSLLLDDSYSSSPAAAEAALETLAALEGRRKIAVLGDMLELGDYEAAGHEQVGRRAAGVLDLLVTKGIRARRIAEAARAAGMSADQVIVTYTAEDAARAVLNQLGPGDVALVKGSLATRMEQVVRPLLADPGLAAEQLVRQDAAWQQIITICPDRPTWLEIDLGAIAHNVRRLATLAGDAQLMISLKADAYGHGAVQVAQTALLNGATWLGVACLSEGLTLRRAGIAAPILILGYTPAWQARDVLRHDLTATVFDLDVAQALARAAVALDRPARVHVKVDTGMGRLGVFPEQAADFVRALGSLPGLAVEGIFTHLAVADGASEWETAYTGDQLAAFDRTLADLAAAGIEIPLVHAANSAALLQSQIANRKSQIRNPQSAIRNPQSAIRNPQSLVRVGIAVYGLDPSPQVRCPADFRPALAWKTQVAQVKELPAGSYVGYGATYRTAGVERIAVIPVGYADGFRRAPQHWGQVLVRGRRATIVGRVCMDQAMLDVTGIPGVQQGDEVVLIGRQGEDAITAEEVAARLGTINYEVVSAILARVPRETFA
ncbi:MAG: alanine racemase [Chloroflexi bacterium]|nr:alanine racemase [Chloroflexota bacterium]